VITGAVRDNAARSLLLCELCDGVYGAPELKGPAFLQMLTFEEKRSPSQPVERSASHYRRAVGKGGDADGRLLDVSQATGVLGHVCCRLSQTRMVFMIISQLFIIKPTVY
jgi:hypothetical protein